MGRLSLALEADKAGLWNPLCVLVSWGIQQYCFPSEYGLWITRHTNKGYLKIGL